MNWLSSNNKLQMCGRAARYLYTICSYGAPRNRINPSAAQVAISIHFQVYRAATLHKSCTLASPFTLTYEENGCGGRGTNATQSEADCHITPGMLR
jgi:hypothetical protein